MVSTVTGKYPVSDIPAVVMLTNEVIDSNSTKRNASRHATTLVNADSATSDSVSDLRVAPIILRVLIERILTGIRALEKLVKFITAIRIVRMAIDMSICSVDSFTGASNNPLISFV